MTTDNPPSAGRLLRQSGAPKTVGSFRGVQIDDPRLGEVLSPYTKLLCLYEGTLHGEGPIWDPRCKRLYWSDVPNRRLLEWHPDGQVTVAIDATFFMNGNALDTEGRLVHCEHGRRCISRTDKDGQTEPIVAHFEGKRLNSPNDVTVAADGAVWFTDPIFGILMPNQGSLVEPELDHRSVYRFDPTTNELRRMADFEQPNGLFFSPDGKRLYVSDTSLSLREIPPGDYVGDKHEIVAFDVAADASLSNRRFVCHTDHGYPDGFCVDERGWIWTTAADGIHVWSAERKRLGFIQTSRVASNCCFGGPNMRRLFIAATDVLLAIDLREAA